MVGLHRYVDEDVPPKIVWQREAVTICTHVGNVPTRNLDLMRDAIEGEKSSQRR
jgi:hypothetical protein